LLALVAIFLPWASAGDLTVRPFTEGAVFRLGDWLGDTESLDGFVVAGVAAIGLLATLVRAKGGPGQALAGGLARLLGGLLVPLALIEIQFVLSDDAAEVGTGLWILAAGGLVAAVAGGLPRRL
jgi:hypothetical protein